MTLSQRIAALDGPDRRIDAKIADTVNWWPVGYSRIDAHGRDRRWTMPKRKTQLSTPVDCPKFTASLDAALSIVEPPMQDYVMYEAMKRVGTRGIIVGKFPEQLARAICEVALKERGL